jgi:hypothetical protein
MWPHYFTSTFSADNERIFRRNAIFLPLYQLVLLFVFFVGFAAVLQVPGLSGERIDESLLLVSREEFGPFVVGLIGATGLLTALVPGLRHPDGGLDGARQERLRGALALHGREKHRNPRQGARARGGFSCRCGSPSRAGRA